MLEWFDVMYYILCQQEKNIWESMKNSADRSSASNAVFLTSTKVHVSVKAIARKY